MRTMWIFARRVCNGLLSWSIVGAVWLVFGLVFFGLGQLVPEDSKIWLTVAIAGIPLVVAVALRLAMIRRPGLAGWLARRFILNVPGFPETADVPGRVEVTPTTDPGFRHPEAIRQTVERLVARGFVDVGTFDFTMEQAIPTVLLAHPGESVWATLFEAEWSRQNIEFVTRYADRSRAGFSNSPDRGMEPRPNSVQVRMTGADPVALFDRCLAERPAGNFVPVTPETTVEAFKNDCEEYLAWRREHGFTPQERGMMFAPLMRTGLTVLIVGFGYLTVLAVLASVGAVALADNAGRSSVLIIVPLVFGAVLLPFLLVIPALRWMGGRRKGSAESKTACAAQPDPREVAAGPFRLERQANLDHMFNDEAFDRSLRSFGFEGVGTYLSPVGLVSLSVRPDDGTYAAVWCPEMRPWVEIVIAGADGSHWRATPVSAPDAEGRVTIKWAAGVAELEPRCAATAGGVARAALSSGNVAIEMERHLEADPDWRAQLAAGAAYSRRHGLSLWRLLLPGLFSPWLLAVLLYLVLVAAESWFGWQHEYINSDRASGVLIIAVLGYVIVWPWLKAQYAASRQEAEDEKAAVGNRSS